LSKLNYWGEKAKLNLVQIFMTIEANHDGELHLLLTSLACCGSKYTVRTESISRTRVNVLLWMPRQN